VSDHKPGRNPRWVEAKYPGGTLFLTVSSERITIKPRGLFGPLARLLGLKWDVDPREATVAKDVVGLAWSESFKARQAVVITAKRRTRLSRDVYLALIPNDGDTERLQEALGAAGARPTA
jgi:hypothetical protein